MADWPRPTRAAARVTLRSVSSASNATSRFRSSLLKLAWSIAVIDIIDWNDDTESLMFYATAKRPLVSRPPIAGCAGRRAMRIAIVGADDVGRALGAALRAKGHAIVYGIPEPERSDESNVKSVREALNGSEVVILATPWVVTEAIVCEHATDLADKIVIDATNPLNPAMTGLALGFLASGVELLQSQARQAKFFKAFNATSAGVLAHPELPEGKAAMLVAGPSGPDKTLV